MPESASVCILTSRKAREQHGNSHEELQALSDAISTLKVFKSCRAAELRRRMQWNSAIDSTASACRPVFQEPYRRQWLPPDTGGVLPKVLSEHPCALRIQRAYIRNLKTIAVDVDE
jgi:hypothetical protein